MSAMSSLQQRISLPTRSHATSRPVRASRLLPLAPRAGKYDYEQEDIVHKAQDVGEQMKRNLWGAGQNIRETVSDATQQPMKRNKWDKGPVDQMQTRGGQTRKMTSGLSDIAGQARGQARRTAAGFSEAADQAREIVFDEGTREQWYDKIPVSQIEPPSLYPSNWNQLFLGFGTLPELANCRLAMLGFVAAIASEIFTHRTVWEQLTFTPAAPVAVLLTFAIFIYATYVPAKKNVKLQKVGIWTPQAEVFNGRLAIVGFVALLVTEALKNGPLIGA